MSSFKKISTSVIERVAIALLAVAIVCLGFAVSAQAQEGTTAPVSAPATVESPATPMGPAAPSVERVANTVLLPQIVAADCFNVYRNGVLIGDCVQPLIDMSTGDWYFDDSSEVVTPASKWTYEVSAVNATGESPRYSQGGPYEDWSNNK